MTKKLLVPIAMMFLATYADSVVAQDAKAGALTIEQKTLKTTDGTEIQADFGRLVVPENRDNSDSPLIKLAFVRLKSIATEAKPPLIYLAGGPGGSSTGAANSPAALQARLPILSVCDLILLDQRGTGRSEPDLNWTIKQELPSDFLVDRNKTIKYAVQHAKQARQHFLDQGRDLNGYTTLQAAHDINDLRIALGLEKVSLFGFSYGTHLALATIKYHGNALANVVMVGVEGLDMTYKLPLNMDTQFRKLSILVSQDERVAKYVPDLVQLYQRVARKLEQKPMEIKVRAMGKSIKVQVGRFGLDMILRWDIGDASDIPVFPRLLYSIDQGDPAILRAFVQKRVPVFSRMNAMSVITDGASGASHARMKAIQEQQKTSMFSNCINAMHPEIADAFGTPDLGDEFREPIVSNVRTLFLSGTLDFNTPPMQAEQVRFGFPNSTHIIVENAGHEQIIPQPEIQKALVRFINGEDVNDVHVSLPPPRFVPIEGYDPEVTHWSVPRRR